MNRKKSSLSWLALMIGNSRLHWAGWSDQRLELTWDMPHLPPEITACLTQQLDFAHGLEGLDRSTCLALEGHDGDWLSQAAQIPAHLPLRIASVVPAQTQLWQVYAQAEVIRLEQIPLGHLYPTLGIDRALALLGAATRYGLPSLVIDAGTALTLTGVNAAGQLVGGAILPGLQLQLRSLAEHTASLPQLSHATHSPLYLPPRWSTTTSESIWSGVVHTLLSGIRDFILAWQQEVSGGAILLTGGDGALLRDLLSQQAADLSEQIQWDPHLIFRGMQAVVVG